MLGNLFRKHKKYFLYALKKTWRFFFNEHQKKIIIGICIYALGSIIYYLIKKEKDPIFEEILIQFCYYVAPVTVLFSVVLIWNWIKADLNLKLENTNTKIANNIDSNNKYYEYVGSLWDLLQQYDYTTKSYYYVVDLLGPSYDYYSSSYKELNSFATSLFAQPSYQKLIRDFLSNFIYLNIAPFILEIYRVKPKFKTKKEFDKKKKNIFNTINEINNIFNSL
ncbi:MAG: hypothetical protein JRJ44_02700 [Deltaproteobacteria bacterium]|nr:hypothetical protein [Deltaproteobacteria bacterium]